MNRTDCESGWLLLDEVNHPLENSASDHRTPWRLPFWRPLLGLMVVTLILRETDWELTLAGQWYRPETNSWPLEKAWPLMILYHGAPMVGLLVATIGFVMMLRSWWINQPRPERFDGLFLVVVALVAPLLIVNWGFKEYFGRPRPIQLRQFGGEFEFHAIGSPGLRRMTNSSFPSGHAAICFYVMTPSFILARRGSRWTVPMLCCGLILGTVMGMARILQGAHFVSDILWSAGIVYFLAWFLDRWMFPDSTAAISPHETQLSVVKL